MELVTIVIVLAVFIIAIKAKKFLYAHEHDASIRKELKTFDNNVKAINDLEKVSDYELGSNHLYK
jgi:hypothetical protein